MSILASFPKNSLEEVRISLDNFNGHELLNIRVFYNAGDRDMRPGKKGLAIRLEQLPELMLALAKVEQAVGRKSEFA